MRLKKSAPSGLVYRPMWMPPSNGETVKLISSKVTATGGSTTPNCRLLETTHVPKPSTGWVVGYRRVLNCQKDYRKGYRRGWLVIKDESRNTVNEKKNLKKSTPHI